MTFVDKPGKLLADEVRRARGTGMEIVIVHENDEIQGGCAFSRRAAARIRLRARTALTEMRHSVVRAP
eukprot:504717-Prymnesium_polylepis.1